MSAPAREPSVVETVPKGRVPQPSKLKAYCFTLNNPEGPVAVPDAAAYMIYQEETAPDTGTKHFQGYVEFKTGMRISQIKKLGAGWDKMHLEPRKGTQEQAIAYCQKEESRTAPPVVHGIPSRSGVKRSYDVMISALKDGTFTPDDHLGEYLKHKRSVDEYIRDSKKLKLSDLEVPDISLYPWQKDIIAIIGTVPDRRKVYWYYDTVGGTGKSTFVSYLMKNYGAVAMSTTVKERVIRAYQGEPVVVINITRNEGQKNQVNYSILETLKDGHGFNTMYEPGTKLWKIPHVFVFSNIYPDVSALSSDRWVIVDIGPQPQAVATANGFDFVASG